MSLPLLMMGFEFFYGTLTSNTGLLYLLIGHFVLVPMLGYFTNTGNLPNLWGTDKGLFVKAVASSLVLLTILNNRIVESIKSYLPDDKKENVNYGYFLLLVFLILVFGAAYVGTPLSDVFNPIRWVSNPGPSTAPSESCSIFPVKAGETHIWSRPSLWSIHTLFLAGFLVANALAVYNLPVPSIVGDDAETKDRQSRLATRVNNRKFLSMMIALIVVVVTLILLYVRYSKTDCESNFKDAVFPLLIVGFFGVSWYSLVQQYCGISPPDVLGIVSGLISPDLIDSPIVCVGSET